MNNNILKAINEVLEGKGDAKVNEISAETHLRNDLGLDSFDLAELTVRVEEYTNVDIFEDGLIETVGEINAKIEKK